MFASTADLVELIQKGGWLAVELTCSGQLFEKHQAASSLA
jgi:hypothetical protein